MEHRRRPYGPPPWEDADGWVVADEEEEADWSAPVDGRPGYSPEGPPGYGPEGPPAGPAPAPYPQSPEPWYGQPTSYGEDPYRPEAQPEYWPAQPPPQPYEPGPQASPPEAGYRWYREVAPGQWVLSDPPVSAYPANGGYYPAPQQYSPPPAPPPPPPPPPAPAPAPRVPEQYVAPTRYEPVAPPVSAPVQRDPPVDRRPPPPPRMPWESPQRQDRRGPPPLPELDEEDAAEPPERSAEASTLAVLSWTLCFFLVPVLAYLGWALTRSDVADPNCVDETGAPCMSPRGEAIEALVNVGPTLAAALFLAAVAAVVMRRLTASWRASTVGFAAAVVGATAVTLTAGIVR